MLVNQLDDRIDSFSQARVGTFLHSCCGIIHVGANTGQERKLYSSRNLPVVWIEPLPEQFSELVKNIGSFPGQIAINALISDRDGATHTLHIANNDGAASSILALKHHKDIWPDIRYVGTIEMRSSTLPSALRSANIDVDSYDALVPDTQGSELMILRGAGELLPRFRFIKTEAADFEVYEDCATVEQIRKYLSGFGFVLKGKHRFAKRAKGGACYDLLFERFR